MSWPRPTVAIQTHGCKLNQADSNKLSSQFIEAGYEVVHSPGQADVIVLNTCTVTATADAKARQALRAARRRNPNALIIATGCYAQRAAEELNRLDAVSLVVGNTQKDSLVSQVSQRLSSPEAQPVAMPVSLNAPKTRVRAMVKIQEGCNQVCAYCIVPRVRGRERSIPLETLVEQINRLEAEGAQEVVLTGTQLGTYGFDLPDIDLTSMLWQLLKATDVPRIRVSSLQAQEITPELVALWQDPRLCPHFHIPLQCGSDTILKAMRRRYDTARFAKTVELVRSEIPDAAITSDIIVGFPGEGEAEFEESLRFADSIGFSDIHVFPYSSRPGTSAAYLNDTVSEPVKRQRVFAMLEMSRRHFLDFRTKQHGEIRPVLWESSSKKSGQIWWSGLTDNYTRVAATSDADLRNTITPSKLGHVVEQTVLATVTQSLSS